MKKLFAVLIAVCLVPFTFGGCALTTVEGNGEEASKVFEGNFDSFVLDTLDTVNPLPVVVVPAETPRIIFKGDADLIEKFTFKQSSGRLKVNGSSLKRYKSQLLSVTIEGPVAELSLGGNVSVEIGALKENASVKLSGASKGEIAADCKSLRLKMSGSSELLLTGAYDSVEIDASGSADLKCAVDIDSLTVKSSGSFEMSGRGTAADASFKSSGSSDFALFDLVVGDIDIDVSGSSSFEVNAVKTLTVDGSGSTNVVYKGDAVAKSELSGSGKVRKYE